MAKRRNRRKRRKKSIDLVTTIVFLVALAVFLISGVQLIRIGLGYMKADLDYKKVNDLVIISEEKDTEKILPEQFKVNFDVLLKKNPDTIGWIRFYEEPKRINYPIVKGQDNDEYLHKTFEGTKSATGAIFADVNNGKDFSDPNVVIYGHRMKNGSMFRHLQDYDRKSFWEKNPNFYIYTPDGREITYQVFAAGEVLDTSEIYQNQFADESEFSEFLSYAKKISLYDTGVELNKEDHVVTLSTCTSASNDHRFVVCGVKKEEKVIGEASKLWVP